MERRAMMKGAGAAAMLPLMMSGVATAEAIGPETVYELRVYHLHEGKLPLILDRFRTKERAIFARCGMHEVAFWVPVDGEIPTNTLVYVMRHKSRDAARESWKKFVSDPEWVKLKAETEKDGEFVAKHDITFLKLTDFSPVI